ncbi:hypothetical protein M413DRAFT_151431 [Hebeloma cylindrosporum]|uniref:Uncharacterized protein n=1 Tax=Hebeloma cylindrosporum TaxID=76867 RepID=A0A0C3BYC8_HEBCY|nr:hypothetical protein M413DRAFT_151431 [Hebeloma cylindrosporum h7]
MEEDRDDLESSSSSMDMMISPRLQQPAETVVDPTYRYLGARYRFVQLAQTIKTRIAHPDCCCGYTFDQAVGLESDIRRWESEALASLQQDREQEVDRPIVQTQKFEHTLMANLLLVKVYSPFLRQAPAGSAATGGAGPSSSSPLPTATSSPAAQTSVGAAHAILRAAKSLHSITSAGNGIVMLPTMLDFYPLDKLVFDSVVVCAHASLTGKVPYPSSFVGGGGVADGSTLLEDVMSGIHLLSEIGVSDEQMRSVVDAIRKRVVSRGVEVSAGYPANVLKRKHDQVDMGIATDRGSTDGAPAGSSNPALTPSAFDPGNNNSNSGPDQRQRHRHGALSDSTANTSELPPTEQHGKKDKSAKAVSQSKEREKKDNKKPKQGIRLRPGKDHLAAAKARAQPAAIQPPFTSKPRPLPTADTVLTFQQQQKQELQSRSQSQSVSAVAASTTSSAAESPGAPAASGDGTRSRSNSFSHVQKSEPRQGSQQAERIDGGSQYTFGIRRFRNPCMLFRGASSVLLS